VGKHWTWAVIGPGAFVLLLGATFAHMRFRVDRAETLSRLQREAEQAVSPAQNCFTEVRARLLFARSSLVSLPPDNVALNINGNLDPLDHCESAIFLTAGRSLVASVPEFARQKFSDMPVATWSRSNRFADGNSSFLPVMEGPYENASQDWYVVIRVPYQLATSGWIAAAIPISRLFDTARLKAIRGTGADVRIAGINGISKTSNVYLKYAGTEEFSVFIQKKIAIGSNYLALEISPFPMNNLWRLAAMYGLLVIVLAVSASALGYEYHAEVQRLKAEVMKRDRNLREVKSQLNQAVKNRGELETLSIGAAYQDVLTGLPNWLYFLEHLDRSLQRNAGHAENTLTVVLAELDHLSEVQKRLDSTEMEQLLTQAVSRFERELRPADLAAARLGQGELAFLLFDSNNNQIETQMSKQLTGAFEEPFMVNDKEVILSTSLGFASSRDYTRAAPMVQGAEIDLDRVKAKQQKKTRSRKKVTNVLSSADSQEFTDVKTAIERNELRLDFLPIIELQGRAIQGLEVLARWHHPFKGMISPSRFIPLAEATGQAEYLTKWVMNESIRQLAEWRRTIAGVDHIYVSVNLTPHEFGKAGLASSIESILAENNVPASRLFLELDEEILSGDVRLAVDLTQRLQKMGIGLSFEEFGASFGALSSLRLVAWNAIKLARKFGVAFDTTPEQQQTLRALTHMAQDLNIQCIAKAIEAEKAAAQFIDLGYKLGQGFLFSRPIGPAAVEALLREISGQ
jgi:diguanylate cyclase (GGDEF)-like protein